MKKLFFYVGLGLLSCQCSLEPSERPDIAPIINNESQTTQTRTIERSDNSLFIEEGGRRYAVNPNVVTVSLKSGISKTKLDIKELRSNRLGFIDIQVPEGVDVEEYVSKLEMTGKFLSVEYNTFGEWDYLPNDTRFNDQWYLNSIKAPTAWDVTTGSSDIKVAVIDSGVDWNHPDLGVGADTYSNIDPSLGWNFYTNNSNVITSNGHGTRVAGIIAAKTNNNRVGIAGVAGGKGNRGVTIIPYCIGVDRPDLAVIDDAIIDAVNKGARVISFSFSGVSTTAVTT